MPNFTEKPVVYTFTQYSGTMAEFSDALNEIYSVALYPTAVGGYPDTAIIVTTSLQSIYTVDPGEWFGVGQSGSYETQTTAYLTGTFNETE
jgi:hypothetical protein